MSFAVVIAIVGVGTASANSDSVPCGPPRARTAAASDQARVFELRGRFDLTTLYACARGTAGRWKLGSPWECSGGGGGGCFGAKILRVRGSFVGWVDQETSNQFADAGFRVRVRNARTRKYTVREWYGGDPAPENGHIESFVMDKRGAAAWIWHHTDSGVQPRQRPDGYELRRSGACPPVVLDDGPDVGPTSLRVHDGRIAWKRGGTTRSRRLCHTPSLPR